MVECPLARTPRPEVAFAWGSRSMIRPARRPRRGTRRGSRRSWSCRRRPSGSRSRRCGRAHTQASRGRGRRRAASTAVRRAGASSRRPCGGGSPAASAPSCAGRTKPGRSRLEPRRRAARDGGDPLAVDRSARPRARRHLPRARAAGTTRPPPADAPSAFATATPYRSGGCSSARPQTTRTLGSSASSARGTRTSAAPPRAASPPVGKRGGERDPRRAAARADVDDRAALAPRRAPDPAAHRRGGRAARRPGRGAPSGRVSRPRRRASDRGGRRRHAAGHDARPGGRSAVATQSAERRGMMTTKRFGSLPSLSSRPRGRPSETRGRPCARPSHRLELDARAGRDGPLRAPAGNRLERRLASRAVPGRVDRRSSGAPRRPRDARSRSRDTGARRSSGRGARSGRRDRARERSRSPPRAPRRRSRCRRAHRRGDRSSKRARLPPRPPSAAPTGSGGAAALGRSAAAITRAGCVPDAEQAPLSLAQHLEAHRVAVDPGREPLELAERRPLRLADGLAGRLDGRPRRSSPLAAAAPLPLDAARRAGLTAAEPSGSSASSGLALRGVARRRLVLRRRARAPLGLRAGSAAASSAASRRPGRSSTGSSSASRSSGRPAS